MSTEEDIISKTAEGATKGAISAAWDKISLSRLVKYIKKKRYIKKFGPKAKSKKGLRLGRIKEENSKKVYIFDDKTKKYYWVKTQRVLNGLGYAMSDTYEQISTIEIKDYSQGNPIDW